MDESDRHRQLVTTIETTLAGQFPELEVVDVDVHGGRGGRLTVYVDRPGGVDLAVCEAVTRALDDLRDRYALDVSSPGLDRPLRTVAQFARATASGCTSRPTRASTGGRCSGAGSPGPAPRSSR